MTRRCIVLSAVALAVVGPPAMAQSRSTQREADPDVQYVQMMRLHYHVGMEMTQIAVQHALRDDLRAFAERVLLDQRGDSEELRRIELKLEPIIQPIAAVNAEPLNDALSADPDTQMMIARLAEASGKEFDNTFLITFIAHQDMALQVSRNAARFTLPEIRTFAQRIALRQARIIKELRLIKRAS
jgi:uncharacterized protein (DUF305 family)